MISLVSAIDDNRGLGKNNQLLFKIHEDMVRFKKVTTGHVIIMGRKTFESMGSKPLPNRTNIVITRDPNFQSDGIVVVHSLQEALSLQDKRQAQSEQAQGYNPHDSINEIFIIGGGQIFNDAIKIADRLYLTIVHQKTEGADTFFPDYSRFTKTISEEEKSSDGYNYTFLTLEK